MSISHRRNTEPISDVPLLHGRSLNDVGERISQWLGVKGYCMLTGVLSEDDLGQVLADIGKREGELWQPPVLVQEGLLGFEGSCRIAEFEDPAPTGDSDRQEVGLQKVNTIMWDLAKNMQPFQELVGSPLTRLGCPMLHQTGLPTDETDLTLNDANKYCNLFHYQRMLILVFVGPGRGKLHLTVRGHDDANPLVLTTIPGAAVIVRTDRLACRFFSSNGGTTHVVSCHLLHPGPAGILCVEEHTVPAAKALQEEINQRLKELKLNEKDDPDHGSISRELIFVMNRTYSKTQQIAVTGLASRASTAMLPEVSFSGGLHGCDVIEEVPTHRWDHNTVYDPSPNFEDENAGKTNCKHMCYMDGLTLFDANAFGIRLYEVKSMDPNQRQVLEVSYESFYRSGMRRKDLRNCSCGVYVGFGSSEWDDADKKDKQIGVGAYVATGDANSILAGRVSFSLGLKGASMVLDTEAASSLTCVYWACESIEHKGRGRAHDLTCAAGIHLCLSKVWWPLMSAARFLCPAGRCFTFNDSARGHVRCEGVGSAVLRRQKLVMEGEESELDASPLGRITGAATNNSGLNASLSAPSGPAECTVLADACRKSRITAADVDAVECHGAGNLLADAVEAVACEAALRNAVPDNKTEFLFLGSNKTNTGNMIEQSGLSSLMKVVFSLQMGLVSPLVHFRVLNRHIEELSERHMCMPGEIMEYRMHVNFVGVSARGIGGTNVHVHLFGAVNENLRTATTPKVEQSSGISFWPAGGGSLERHARPQKAYYITGSWTSWEKQELMESEGSDCFGYTLTLGVNRWEQFQILVDGDPDKRLCPSEPRAPSGGKVWGPSHETASCYWMLDGRSQSSSSFVSLDWEDAEDPRTYTFENPHHGLPGQKYRVRLLVKGKWRTVTWTRLPSESPESPLSKLPLGSYFVAGSWSNWRFEEMHEETDSPGKFSAEVTLATGEGEFVIVRNKDWQQTIFPVQVQEWDWQIWGPDEMVPGSSWPIQGTPRGSYNITFSRNVVGEVDEMSVDWKAKQ